MTAPGELRPGDPIPPERTGGMAGFVVGECGHRVAGSEWDAGFRNCERCGDETYYACCEHCEDCDGEHEDPCLNCQVGGAS